MSFQHRLQRTFKPRFAVIYPFALLTLFYGSCDEASLWAGTGFIAAGVLLRLWSNGYAIKNDKLTISGPYAYVRNPLYVGTFLMVLGFAIALKMGWMGLLFLLALGCIYFQTIRSEQELLTAKFGDAYLRYRVKVPPMWPALTPYTNGEKWPFNLQRLIFSKEHKVVLWTVIILVIFHLKTRLLIERGPMTQGTWALIILVLLLVALDVAYELNKNKIHHK